MKSLITSQRTEMKPLNGLSSINKAHNVMSRIITFSVENKSRVMK